MITVRVEGLKELTEGLNELQRSQIPFATALALTRTARRVKQVTYRQMWARWKSPAPFVMGERWPSGNVPDDKGALRVEQATKTKLRARVWLKDEPYERQRVAMDPLLLHHFSGGGRVPKGMELWFREQGLLGADEFLVPKSIQLGDEFGGARLNQYGNISAGQLQQVFSQLQMRRSSGYDNAPTGSRRSVKNQEAAGRIFWSAGPGGAKRLVDLETGIAYGHTGQGAGRKNNLPKGVWVRHSKTRLECILLAIDKAPQYKRLFNLGETARNVLRSHFADEFRGALRDAAKTAGKLGGGASRADRQADWRTRAYG